VTTRRNLDGRVSSRSVSHYGSPPMTTRERLFPGTTSLALGLVLLTLYWSFFRAPFERVMGAAQKIFYFHVPAAMGLYLSAAVCFVGSAAYLYKPSDARDALARAGGDTAVCFGMMVMTTGPIWARPIWGVYWTWEPRLMTLLLQVMIYVAYVMLRGFAGDGDGERKFAAALGVLGAANLPIIHYAVQFWGGNHPRVVSEGGGGLGHPDMKIAFGIGMLAFSVLTASLVWSRFRLHLTASRLARAEEDAVALGLVAEESY
jgi:heme exporter protein C